jgi:hypothetical protein
MSIATFVRKVVKRYILDEGVTIVIAFVVAVVVHPWARRTIPTAYGVYKVCLLLVVDKVMSSLSTPGEGAYSMLVHWLASTALLSAVTAVGSHFPRIEILSLLNTYAFYTYAENGKFLTGDPDLNQVLPAIAFIGCSGVSYSMQFFAHEQAPVLKALLQGTGMIMTNVLVTLLMHTDDNASDAWLSLMWLLLVLVVVDNMHSALGIADEIKSYAVWKSAQQIDTALSSISPGVSVLSAGIATLYTTAVQHVAGLNVGIVTHTLVLGGCNAALGVVRNAIAHTAHVITLLILVSTLTIIEILLHALQQ